MASLPKSRNEVLDTPYGQVVGTSFSWGGGQYCALHTAHGIVGCGIYDVDVANEFGMAIAIAKGTPEKPLREPEDLYDAKLVRASTAARRLGIEPGMTGLEALARLLAHSR